MSKVKVYSQLDPPPFESEKVSTRDLPVLDKVTITKVTDFMHKFAEDATFTPPTIEVMYDTDKYDVGVDDDALSVFDEDFLEDFNSDDMEKKEE